MQSNCHLIRKKIFVMLAGAVVIAAVVWAANPIAQTHEALRQRQLFVVLLAGVLGLCNSIGSASEVNGSRPSSKLLFCSLLLLPVYSGFQAVPMPLWLMRIMSPTRAGLSEGLGRVMPRPNWASISVTPAETIYHCLWIVACIIVFLVIYDLSWSFRGQPWLVAAPLITIATLEAILGMAQVARHSDLSATGTYSITNHYAGLLEMILPLAGAYPAAILNNRSSQRLRMRRSLLAIVSFVAAASIGTGIIDSMSRMGLVASIGALLLGAVLAPGLLGSGPKRWVLSAGIGTAVVLAFALLMPSRLISRFADLAGNDENRIAVWRETLVLIKAYPLFGCGLGGYESAFVQFQHSAPLVNQDYAHNDYLQYLAELGIVGFVLALAPAIMIVKALIRSLLQPNSDARWLSLGCASSVFGIILHSLADFNLYVPANMLVLAWILAMSATPGSKKLPRFTQTIRLCDGEIPDRSRQCR
jgi:O-antigen ligase